MQGTGKRGMYAHLALIGAMMGFGTTTTRPEEPVRKETKKLPINSKQHDFLSRNEPLLKQKLSYITPYKGASSAIVTFQYHKEIDNHQDLNVKKYFLFVKKVEVFFIKSTRNKRINLVNNQIAGYLSKMSITVLLERSEEWDTIEQLDSIENK